MYETEHDFSWLLDALQARGRARGDPPQELPFLVGDRIAPSFDAFGWARFGQLQFETASAVNNNIISLAPVAANQNKLYPYVQVRASGGAPAGVFWVGINDGTNVVAISDAVSLVDGQATSPPKRPTIVPSGFFLQARSDQLPGAAVTIFIEAFSITMERIGEYIPPS